MSMMLMVKAMRIKVGNPLRKLVLIKLADNASDSGECWPSHQHIADQCEISRRSVINHINKLEEMGFLRKENRTKNNEKQSNLYFLTLDNPQPKELGSAGDSLPSERDAQGSAGDAQPPNAGDAHRISHSSEPVNEPMEAKASLSSSDDSANASSAKKQIEMIIEEWNKSAPNRVVAVTSGSTRDTQLRARLKQFTVDDFIEAIRTIPFSPFLLGQNSRGWVIKFDWFIKPSNFQKVLEGNYVGERKGVNNHAGNSTGNVPYGVRAQEQFAQAARDVYESGILDGFDGKF